MAFRLDRFTTFDEPSERKRRLHQLMCEKIEGQFSDIAAVQADLASQLAQILTAQATATAAAREAARLNSYTVPTNVLTAADVGTDCTITIAAHTRVYPVQGTIDVADVAILAGSIAGLAFSTTYYVYYDDTSLASTAPTFLATTTAATAQVGAAAGRHLVGVVTTPADGAAASTGTGGAAPPGGGGGTPLP